MSEINFFTPVYYGVNAQTNKEKALEVVDNYFYLYGKRAVVISERVKNGKEQVTLEKTKFSPQTFFKIVATVLSFFTVIIPIGLLITKAFLRSSHQYTLMDSGNESLKKIPLPQTINPSIEKQAENPQVPTSQALNEKPSAAPMTSFVIDEKTKEECLKLLNQKLDFDVESLEQEFLNKAPEETREDIELFFFFYKNRLEIFEGFTHGPDEGIEKATKLQIASPCKSKLPLYKKSDFKTFNKQDLKNIAHRLLSIKRLHEAYSINPEGSLELFQAIKKGACFTEKRENIDAWMEKQNQNKEQEQDVSLNVTWDPNREWSLEGKNILYFYLQDKLEVNPKIDKKTAYKDIEAMIGESQFKGKKVTQEEIIKVINENWDQTLTSLSWLIE